MTVHEGDPGALPYPNYFADLSMSGRSVAGEPVEPGEEGWRTLRPYGGVRVEMGARGIETRVRGPLEGAGSWTHEYGTPANPCSSLDQIVEAPLGMLWYRDSDFDMPSRHGRGPAPVFTGGRLIVEGLNGLRAVSAYNGRLLWEYPLPEVLEAYDQEHLVGVAATGSNLCTDGESVYVCTGARCLRIDVELGELVGRYEVPDAEADSGVFWGYVAVEDGTVYGSSANPDHVVRWTFVKSDMTNIRSESNTLFALDVETGRRKWVYQAKDSIRHNTIAIGLGRVFFVDRPLSQVDRLDFDAEAAKRRGETGALELPNGELVCLDAATGAEMWRKSEDVYGTLLAVSEEHDLLLMTQQHSRFKLPSEAGGRMTAFRASTGERIWDAPSDPRGKGSRPVLVGRTIYNEPGAWDLLTGKRSEFNLSRSYGCGIMAGAPKLMVYRSATLGYVDLEEGEETENYGGFRPGCWINAIPAGGLVLVPDATDSCVCSYLVKAWVALQPYGFAGADDRASGRGFAGAGGGSAGERGAGGGDSISVGWESAGGRGAGVFGADPAEGLGPAYRAGVL